MKQKVDIENWDRAQNWKFMHDFVNSWYSITSEVECTKSFTSSKEQHRSFFIKYLHAILRAVNEIREFGYRADGDDGVCFFDRIGATVPISVPGKTFYIVYVPYIEDYNTFYDNAKSIFANIPEDGEPYGVEKELVAAGETGVVNVSATPGMYFTSMTFTFRKPIHACDWPLINVGKAITRGEQMVMPISLYVDHAFVDGSHITSFFEKVQLYLESEE